MIRLGFRQALNRRSGVVIWFTPAIRHILETALAVAALMEDRINPMDLGGGRMAKVLPVTSAYEGVHTQNSRHYRDEAVDFGLAVFRSRDAKRWFRQQLARQLGPAFTVLLEKEGEPGEHLHVQVRKGATYPALDSSNTRSS